jgi:hypothetical protein
MFYGPRFLDSKCVCLGVLTLAGLLLFASGAFAKPLWSKSPDKGFVDDAMAFSRDGSKFAYIHTDSATFMDVVVLDTQSMKEQKKLSFSAVTRVPQQLTFVGNDKLVLISSDSSTGKVGALLYDLTNSKEIKRIDKLSKVRVVSYQGKQLLAAVSETKDRKGNTRMSVALHDPQKKLRRVKRARITVRSDNTLRTPPLRVMYWEAGNVYLVGMKKGKYDRKRDMRLPDTAVRWDVFARKQRWAKEPKDLVVWNRALAFRNDHAGQRRFMHVGNSLQTLYFCDRGNDLVAIKLPVEWKLYEARSLKQHETWDGKTLYFSMTIDPVNPNAVARKKADIERADIYRLDPGNKPVMLGKVLTNKRRFRWVVGNGKFAYLRKLKGFGRGGKTLEIHSFIK